MAYTVIVFKHNNDRPSIKYNKYTKITNFKGNFLINFSLIIWKFKNVNKVELRNAWNFEEREMMETQTKT